MSAVIGPGSTIGILGSGQLGRMLALSARQMGYRVAVFGGDRNTPCGQVSDHVWPGDFADQDQLREFASVCDVVTYEFENIPADAAAFIAQLTPLRPGVALLSTAQNRFAEKTALSKLGLSTARFRMVHSAAELQAARVDFGGAVILKANTDGYDGKGQWTVASDSEAENVWDTAGLPSAIVEERIEFDYELSIVAGRYSGGECVFFSPFLNHHAHHILDVSICGAAQVAPIIADEARAMARSVLERFEVVGVLCIELFLTSEGELLVNEIAPRPHNSGHLTIEAYNCSQFELQLRTVCNLPKVALNARMPAAAMANLLGQHLPDAWTSETLDGFAAPDTHLHLYGKAGARTNRKVGHVTVLGDEPTVVEQHARNLRAALRPGSC